MKRVAAVILIIMVILGMSGSIFAGIQNNRQVEETANDTGYNTESAPVEYEFSGPPAGTPQVTGPTSQPGQ